MNVIQRPKSSAVNPPTPHEQRMARLLLPLVIKAIDKFNMNSQLKQNLCEQKVIKKINFPC